MIPLWTWLAHPPWWLVDAALGGNVGSIVGTWTGRMRQRREVERLKALSGGQLRLLYAEAAETLRERRRAEAAERKLAKLQRSLTQTETVTQEAQDGVSSPTHATHHGDASDARSTPPGSKNGGVS